MKDYRLINASHFRLKHIDPDDTHVCDDKETAKEKTAKFLRRLDTMQERLYAEGRQALLVVLQGMDTAGKDGTIRQVMSGVNPQSCQVTSFKVPTHEEAAHDFLWRIHRNVPPRGYIGIFNRSHYEDVLVTRVHGIIDRREAHRRYKEINQFEKTLTDNGTKVVKFFLHISKDEQKERLQARIDDPQKRWKFSTADLAERTYWERYQKVYEETLSSTSTDDAPWHIVPANHKWYRNFLVAHVLVDALEEMNPRLPKPDPTIHFDKLRVR